METVREEEYCSQQPGVPQLGADLAVLWDQRWPRLALRHRHPEPPDLRRRQPTATAQAFSRLRLVKSEHLNF